MSPSFFYVCLWQSICKCYCTRILTKRGASPLSPPRRRGSFVWTKEPQKPQGSALDPCDGQKKLLPQERFFASAEARFFCVDKRTQKPQGSALDPCDGQLNFLPAISKIIPIEKILRLTVGSMCGCT